MGASLETWEKYFPNATIIGADILPACKKYEAGRIKIAVVDQSNVEDLTRLAIERGPFDIIIEDGSHQWNHQITSLRTLFPFLKNEGLYIVEDLQTNYGALQADYQGVATATCVDYLKKWLDLRVADTEVPINQVEDAFLRTYGRAVAFMTFIRHACVIKKRFPPFIRAAGGGSPLFASDASRSLAVSVLGHLGNIGDVRGDEGYVNSASDAQSFQGLSIECGGNPLEYRVRFADGSWSTWTRNGGFAGTRGQSKALTAFTVRLLDAAKQQHSLRAAGRFAGSSQVVEARDAQDCAAASGGALCGIQIELTRRAG